MSDLIYWLVTGALMIMSFVLGVYVAYPKTGEIEDIRQEAIYQHLQEQEG